MYPIVLNATTKTIEAVLSGAITTSQPEFTAGWADNNGTVFTEGASDGALNSTTPVTLVAAPAASTRRVIKYISIQNKDTVAVTVTVSYNNNATLRQIVVVTLAAGETWTTDGTFTTTGAIKYTVSTAVGGSNTQVQYNNAGVFGGITGATTNGTVLTIVSGLATTAFSPSTDDAATLGTTALGWSDLHGATGFTWNIANGNWVATHSSGIMTVSTGDLRVTNNFTNAASVVTVGGAQTLTNKTLTSPAVNSGTLTTSSLAGAQQLAEGASIRLDAAGSADGAFTGITIAGTAGATLAFGDLIYLAAADSRWELTDADAAATAGDVIIGLCVLAAASDGDPTVVLLYGNIRADAAFPALTIGAQAYVSTTTGDIQVAQPSGTDDVIRVVGFALTADELMFNPSPDYITHT